MTREKKFGIIWDQTGVLYKYGRNNVEKTFSKVLNDLGISFPKEIFDEKYRGTSLANQLVMWKKDFGLEIPMTAKQLSQEAGDLEYGFIDVEKERDEKLISLLDDLKERGVPMVVATSSTRDRAERILEILGLKGYVRDVVSCEDVENHEPAIETVSAAAKKLGLDFRQCIVVEDAASGIRAAKKAGCKTVGFAVYSDEQYDSLVKAGADLVVREFGELSYETFEGLFLEER